MARPTAPLSFVALLALTSCTSSLSSAAATTGPAQPVSVAPTSAVMTDPNSTSTSTTSTTTTTKSTSTISTSTSTTSTTSTTTTGTIAITTTTTTLVPLEPAEALVAYNDNPAMPISISLPRSTNRPFYDRVVESWAGIVEDEFAARARVLIQRREQEAAAARAAEDAARAAAAAAAATATSIPPDVATTTTTTTTTEPPPPPELRVDAAPIVRGAQHSLVRMQSSVLLEGPPEVTTSAFYVFDSGEVIPSRGVIAPARTLDFLELVAALLGERIGEWDRVPTDRLLTDVTITEAGELAVAVPTRYLAPDADPAPVPIGPADAEGFLSPIGRAVAAGTALPTDEGTPDCTVVACVALTFDDGPNESTTQLLDILDQADARGTFFVLGRSVERFPDIARRIVEDGHDIGNHSWAHANLLSQTPEQLAADLASTNAMIEAATGVAPDYLRPTYGKYDLDLRYLSYGLAMWDVDSRDWEHRNPRQTIRRTLDGVTPGSIVVLHDIHATTVAAVPLLIAELRAAGYRLVTVAELIGPADPGAVYWSQTDIEDPPPPTTTTTTTTTVPVDVAG